MDATTGGARSASAEDLRTAMVERLRGSGFLSERVATAMLEVPRHAYVPEVEPAAAYAPFEAVVIKRSAEGAALSSASAPWVVARMLHQALPAPGARVLEVGAGTGYNAALLAELVGPTGSVTTIDHDPEVVDRARRALAGHGRVAVVHGDGAYGYAPHAPYDMITVTAGAYDVHRAWVEQLAPGGRIVVPLQCLPWHMTVAFEREDDGVLRSVDTATAGFIPLAGAGAPTGGTACIGLEEPLLRLHDAKADGAALRDALEYPPVLRWTEVVVEDEPGWNHLYLWLMAEIGDQGLCKFNLTPRGQEERAARVPMEWGGLAVHCGGSFAYLTNRAAASDATAGSPLELAFIAHGSESGELADRLVALVRRWNDGPRFRPRPRIEAHPAGTPDDCLGGRVVLDRPDHRITVVADGPV
ncbi:methyltransferase, FxLD system [Actinocorallia populi]|uniref:methyltransferase, FxLD system n=1 Tax=Actinocorallia populi TaxID=2079200 RepID=UPI000D08EC38|nr:methyltransferase, FxLD system [Actinocorallia populi]